jgi:putative transposase
VIPSNPTRKVQRRYDRTLYKLRYRVENFFQRLKRFRRIATRYGKLAASYYAMVCFAAVMIWLP